MNLELDSILEQSLSQIEAGKASLESCLLSYPTMAGQLSPLLVTAQTLRSIPKPTLSPVAKAQMESRLLAAAAASPLLRPVGQQRKPIVIPRWGWAFSSLTAILLFVFLMTAIMVNASADALPGTPFYPVKRAVEDAWLWVAPARDEPQLHLRFARRRLAEIQTLATQGQFDPALLEAMAADIEGAVADAEKLPPAIALPLVDELAVLLADQQQTLVVLLVQVPEPSRPLVEAALREVAAQLARVDTLRLTLQPLAPVGSPEVSPSPTLGNAVQPVTDTPTPRRTGEPSPSPTGTLTPLPTPDATVRMGPEPSQEPTALNPPVPTETQPPAPTAMQPAEPTPTKVPPGQTKIPPGQTKTPQPPGQTKTPRP